jgi:uncharacterized membrane protein YfcA
MQDFYFVLAGFFVGSVVGLTGVGGGSLMTPLLIFLLGVKPHMAVGTDLLFAAITKSGGTFSLWRQKLIPWRVVMHLSMGSIPGCLATIYALKQVDLESLEVQGVITHTLGVALMLTAASLLYKVLRAKKPHPLGANAPEVSQPTLSTRVSISAQVAMSAQSAPSEVELTQSKHPLWTILLGFIIGTLVTLTSVGAGAIGVSVLMILYPRLPLPRIVAADIAYAVPLTLVAGLGHASLGTVDWPLLMKLVVGSLPGIWVGAHLLTRTPERIIRLALSVLLAWASVKLIFV